MICNSCITFMYWWASSHVHYPCAWVCVCEHRKCISYAKPVCESKSMHFPYANPYASEPKRKKKEARKNRCVYVHFTFRPDAWKREDLLEKVTPLLLTTATLVCALYLLIQILWSIFSRNNNFQNFYISHFLNKKNYTWFQWKSLIILDF